MDRVSEPWRPWVLPSLWLVPRLKFCRFDGFVGSGGNDALSNRGADEIRLRCCTSWKPSLSSSSSSGDVNAFRRSVDTAGCCGTETDVIDDEVSSVDFCWITFDEEVVSVSVDGEDSEMSNLGSCFLSCLGFDFGSVVVVFFDVFTGGFGGSTATTGVCLR